jgi:hypothetical protein
MGKPQFPERTPAAFLLSGVIMAKNKTTETSASVNAYVAAIKEEARRNDCEALVTLMAKATKQPPRMWGSSIVGFGSYHYKYESGREGDICLVGFSSRKGDITVYGLNAAPSHQALISKLGKHKAGKGCLYIRNLNDIDLKVLERLVTDAATAKTRQQSKRHRQSAREKGKKPLAIGTG